MKTKLNMLVLATAFLGLMSSCVPIDPNWSPEQKAQVQSSNAQMAQGVGVGLIGIGAAAFGAAQLNNSYGGNYYYGGRYYNNRGYRHNHYYYY